MGLLWLHYTVYKPIKTRNSKFRGRLGPHNILGTKLNYGKKNSKTKNIGKNGLYKSSKCDFT